MCVSNPGQQQRRSRVDVIVELIDETLADYEASLAETAVSVDDLPTAA